MLPLLIALVTGPHCLDGYFDLGEKAASLGFACVMDEEGKNIGANIRFCDCRELLESGTCNGRDDISCAWRPAKEGWWCHEEGLDVAIIPAGDDSIAVHLQTRFGESDLTGTRISSSMLTRRKDATIVASFAD